jgi:hypothetical protein
VDNDPLCWLDFTPDAILTSCKTGEERPLLLSGALERVRANAALQGISGRGTGLRSCRRSWRRSGRAEGVGPSGEARQLRGRLRGSCALLASRGVDPGRWLGCLRAMEAGTPERGMLFIPLVVVYCQYVYQVSFTALSNPTHGPGDSMVLEVSPSCVSQSFERWLKHHVLNVPVRVMVVPLVCTDASKEAVYEPKEIGSDDNGVR